MPKADTVIEAGDEVLLVLDPGLEEAITAYFAPERPAAGRGLSGSPAGFASRGSAAASPDRAAGIGYSSTRRHCPG